MSELRQRRADGDGNDKVENAGESDHVLIIIYFIFINQFVKMCCNKYLIVDVGLPGGFRRGEGFRREVCR